MTDFDKKFNETLKWVPEEERLRNERGQGFSSSQLIITSIMFIGLLIFITYFMSVTEEEFESLKMIQDPDNYYEDDNYSEGYEYASDELPTTQTELPPLED